MGDTTELKIVESIKAHVYMLRGEQVMLDSDLADIYGYELKAMNQQVKRNIERFPEDFMFQLTREEVDLVKSQIVTSREIQDDNLKSQFVTSSWGGKRKMPYAFTEQGIYMLATVLKGELATKQSIFIMRAFKEMRHFIANNALMFEKINAIELKQLEYQKDTDEKFGRIFEYMANHEEDNQKIHLLSGLLKCPVCGASMYGNKAIKSRKDGTRYNDYFYYGCKHRNMTRGHKCDYKKQISEDKLDKAVIEVLSKLVSNKKFAGLIRSKIDMEVDTTALDQEIAALEKDLRQCYLNKDAKFPRTTAKI